MDIQGLLATRFSICLAACLFAASAGAQAFERVGCELLSDADLALNWNSHPTGQSSAACASTAVGNGGKACIAGASRMVRFLKQKRGA